MQDKIDQILTIITKNNATINAKLAERENLKVTNVK